MSQYPRTPEVQRGIDASHLNLLSVFHYVGAGLAVLGLGFLFINLIFVHLIVNNPNMMASGRSNPPPPAVLAIFTIVVGLFCVASCIANILSANYLRRRKNRTFSMVVAGFNCLHMPLGTVLGVFTFIVLMRESVRDSYETGASH